MAAVGINSSGVEILPNGTRIRQSPQDDRAAMRRQLGLRPATPTVVFVGRMDYRPNQEAIAAICARIAPRCPGVMFLLVGLNPPPIATPGNVMLIGAVESVEGYLGASDLAIVPILRGSGTRIKILDAWAAGLSVLSTSLGAAGLNYQDGVNIVIEDDIDRFPERIQELVRSPAARADLRKGALAAARPYRWETLGRRYTAFLTALVRARVGRQDTWAGRRHARSPG
jgi:glycosyltransferase involved in cell wall biosynthesis